jgi:hypothetical protein
MSLGMFRTYDFMSPMPVSRNSGAATLVRRVVRAAFFLGAPGPAAAASFASSSRSSSPARHSLRPLLTSTIN